MGPHVHQQVHTTSKSAKHLRAAIAREKGTFATRTAGPAELAFSPIAILGAVRQNVTVDGVCVLLESARMGQVAVVFAMIRTSGFK